MASYIARSTLRPLSRRQLFSTHKFAGSPSSSLVASLFSRLGSSQKMASTENEKG
jgi:hypothetical protein